MTDYIEFEAKNVEKALENACQELGLAAENVQYDVVSYGSSGIFGLVGTKKAKIRVKVGLNKGDEALTDQTKIEAKNLVKDAFKISESPDIQEEKIKEELTPEALAQASAAGQEALTRLVNAISEDTVITVENNPERLLFKIEGGNSAMLIGKRGQTLEAIQYLVEKIVNKQSNTRIRVLVDVKGYLGARKASLKKLALQMADKAKKTNKPVTVGQMNAYDRRLVHMSLKDNQDVRTQSVGEGYYRKLIIFPKKRRARKNQRDSEQ